MSKIISSTFQGSIISSTLHTPIIYLGAPEVQATKIDTDNTLSGNSDTALATQKAIKYYTDNRPQSATTVDVTREIQLLASARSVGAAAVDVAALGNFAYWRFVDGSTKEMFCTIDMPHDYKFGADLHIHWHWMSADTVAGNVRWGLTVFISKEGDPMHDAGSETFVTTAINSTTLYAHIMTTIVITPSPAITTDGNCVQCRLRRYGADTLDTYNSAVYLGSWGLHYLSNRLGS